jgi:RNA polymerase sigma-70 factor, ECF subfamily
VTEAEAIRLAQAGDAAAFEFLYRLHGRRVYALCLRMVNNPADAEDLMQEAFLQLFRKIGTFRGESAVDRVNLERSVEKLPPGYRTVFVLHDVQGYEHNEIAEIMGCSVGNSKSQLHKARTRLRDLLQEEMRAQARQERQAAKTQMAQDD